jgi:hypothetical protein
VWYAAIRQVRLAPAADRLELVFEDDPPYALQGLGVPYIDAVLAAVLGAEATGLAVLPS